MIWDNKHRDEMIEFLEKKIRYAYELIGDEDLVKIVPMISDRGESLLVVTDLSGRRQLFEVVVESFQKPFAEDIYEACAKVNALVKDYELMRDCDEFHEEAIDM